MADLKQTFSRQIAKWNVKASSFMEESKIKTYIDTLNREIAEIQKKCGKRAYEMWLENEFKIEQLTPLFEQIAEKQAQLQNQQSLLVEIKDMNRQVLGEQENSKIGQKNIICPNCGAECLSTINFCRECGTKLR